MNMGKNIGEIPISSMGKLYPLKNGNVWASVVGSGKPVVIILSGAGTVAMDYYMIQQMLSKDTTAIIYDRLGTGYSSLCNLPRTSRQVVEEMKELLDVMKVSLPCILVGHSLGGMYARHFATLYPLAFDAVEESNQVTPREPPGDFCGLPPTVRICRKG